MHTSHKERYSDSSLYDFICGRCGITDSHSIEKQNAPCAFRDKNLAREIAALLHGRRYGEELTPLEEYDIAKENMLVCFASSDDIAEFRGVISDEFGAYSGRNFSFTSDLKSIQDHPDRVSLIEMGWAPPKKLIEIKYEWCPNDLECSWRITSDFKADKCQFDIMNRDKLYCRGLVIDLFSLKGHKA